VMTLIEMRDTPAADRLHDALKNQVHVKLAPPG
jgi:hypothetical protein